MIASPRCVLITGASSGIGAALAEIYAASGVRLALLGRNAERLSAVAARCAAKGAEIETALIDMRDGAQLAESIARVNELQPIDLAIASAGVSSGMHADGRMESSAIAERTIEINLLGLMRTVAPLIEPMRRRRRGQIALLSSLAGLRGLPSMPAYSASKAAVKAYGEALRAGLAAQGVRVNVVCPGYVDTPMTDRVRGAKPFLVKAARAAAIIKRGLARDRPLIVFPRILGLGVKALALLPDAAQRRILARFATTIAISD